MTSPEHGMVDGYSVRMVEGPFAGKSWPLTEGVTAIGRGIGCQVRINDEHVSRVQCQILIEAKQTVFQVVGTRNPTFLNGKTDELATLTPGDVISFAGHTLVLDGAPVTESQREPRADRMRTTQSFSDAVHLRAEFDAAAYAADQRLGGDLHGLLGLVRSLGRTESLETLVTRLTEHLRNRLVAERVWMAWRLDSQNDLVLYPPAAPDETRAVPFDIMREACAAEAGMMVPGVGAVGERYTIAAPLVHGREAFGAIAARRSGASGEFTGDDLQYLVAAAECCAPLIRGAERLEQMQRDSLANSSAAPQSMFGNSAAMRTLHTELRQAAAAHINVMLQGETGVGKELAARTIHDWSSRSSGPYVVVNCPAIPAELFESEVFGHERGAFTGASRRHAGLFELAHGGTLFLDEIGELSVANQARLLRAVETGTFRPVGSEKEIQVDVRIVCATNRRLPDKAQSFFRADLYHRLAGIVVHVKPLRERKEDIPELALHFLEMISPHTKIHPKGFTQEALELLCAYEWPGNIRELRNVIERSSYTTGDLYIHARDIRIDIDKGTSVAPSESAVNSLEDLERQFILDVLRRHNNSPAESARELGISRSTFYNKLGRYGIKPRNLPR